MVVIIAKKML